MKLGATITSERGKAVTKTGNEYLLTNITDKNGNVMLTVHITVANSHLQGEYYNVYINNPNALYLAITQDRNNENLNHGKTCIVCGDHVTNVNSKRICHRCED